MTDRRLPLLGGLLVLAVAAALWLLRVSLPSVSIDRGLMLYGPLVLDILQKGHWIVQQGVQGEVASKPPLFMWAGAAATWSAGHLRVLPMTLPSAVATVVTAGVVAAVGRKWFGAITGLLAALVLLVSQSGAEQIVMTRPDPMFALFVTLGAVAVLSAWEHGTGWTWCWLGAALATLTKGPLGLLLIAGGLAAIAWEGRRTAPLTLRGRHALGVALFLLITLGWLALAYHELGQALIDRMLVTELIGHALPAHGPRQGHRRVSGVLMPATFFVLTFAPWSLVTIVALVRTWWRPAEEASQRRRERFLVCWLLTGVVVFSLSPHQDERHLFPLMPPAALLAGRELARLVKGLSPRTVLVGSAIAGAIGLTALGFGYHQMKDRRARGDRTHGMQSLAQSIQARVGPASPLVHVGSTGTLPLFLDQITRTVSAAEAAPLLRGSRPAFVATRDVLALRSALPPGAPELFEVARWPATGPADVVVVSNQPRLEATDRLATLLESSMLELDGMRFLGRRWGWLELARTGSPGTAVITNTSAAPLRVRVRILEGASSTAVDREVPPGARWEIGAAARR
jgi:4-amino-4-deoxy-L-arabinose transferase-like glycosyltransferase